MRLSRSLLLFSVAVLTVVSGCGESSAPRARFVREIEWIGHGQWVKADTHIHTEFSDGGHTVREVVAKGIENGCAVIAITDHADHNRGGATPEYAEAIEVARRQFPETVIIAGLEWNVPPDGGDEHVTLLMPTSAEEWNRLAEFKERFDDHGRETHEEQLAVEALTWLGEQTVNGVPPVLIFNHPSRKQAAMIETEEYLKFWRSVNDLVVGLSGAPGHQKGTPLGSYTKWQKPIDRWDPAAARIGGAWDRVLVSGIDVWAARAASDFHQSTGKTWNDYWPGEFSETWLYVPEQSSTGVLRAFRAGSFFAAHGHIARDVDLTVDVAGLPRPAHSGETIEVSPRRHLQIVLDLRVPVTDWRGESNRIDAVEFIVMTRDGPQVIDGVSENGERFVAEMEVPDKGAVVRARGRRVVPDGPDLMVYTNSVRVNVFGVAPVPAADSGSAKQAQTTAAKIATPFRYVTGYGLLLAAAFSVLTLKRQPMPETILLTPGGAAVESVGPPRRGHYAALAFLFVVIAAYGSWVPFHTRSLTVLNAWEMVRAVPLFEFTYSDRSDWATNVLLFVPIGFCCLAACAADSRNQKSTLVAIPVIIAGCLALSFVIEFVQLWLPRRVFSQNDLAAQTIGTVIGVIAWLTAGQAITDWVRSYTGDAGPKRQVDWLLQAYLAGLIIYSVVPLNLTINPEELYAKFRNGRVVLVPFSGQEWSWLLLGDYLTDVLIFVPVGALAAISWMPAHRPLRSLSESLFLGAMIVAALEFCQLLVMSRFTDMTDIVVGTVGVAVGAWLMHRFSSYGTVAVQPQRGIRSWHWVATAAGYSVLLIAYFWRPFEITDDPDLIRRRFQRILGIPGASLYSVSEFRAITEILRKTLLFAPLGALLTRAALCKVHSRKMYWILLSGCLVVSFCVGLIIELGQVLIIEHTPDTSDALLCALGAAVGIFITARLLRHAD